jgi:hypothetical protein
MVCMHPDPATRWHHRFGAWLESAGCWVKDLGVWKGAAFAVGALLVVLWWIGLTRAEELVLGPSQKNADVVVLHGLVCFLMLVVGVVMMSPVVAPWVAGPLLRWIDGVYLGGSSIERPPLTFVVAERRMLEGRFADAAIEFERLAHWHPREVRPYVDGIRAARLGGDEELARRLYRRGARRCPQAVDQLRASLSAAANR